MRRHNTRTPPAPTVVAGIALAGIAAIVISVVADAVGLGGRSGFGARQMALCATGAMLVLLSADMALGRPITTPVASVSARIGAHPRALLAALAFIGAALVIAESRLYGSGLSPDSTNYAAAARSLLAGRRLLMHDGRLFVHWPPLFPALLAILHAVRIPVVWAGVVVNAVSLALIVLVSGLLLLDCARSRLLTMAGTAAVLVTGPLLYTSAMLWSEALFTALVVTFVLLLGRALGSRNRKMLVAVSVIAATACLVRYMGVVLVATGSLAFIVVKSYDSSDATHDAGRLASATLRDRLLTAVAFAGLSALPLALWVLRNFLQVGTLTGERETPGRALTENLRAATEVAASWLVPSPTFSTLAASTYWIYTIAAVAALMIGAWTWRAQKTRREAIVVTSVILITSYLMWLFMAASAVRFDPIGERLLSPIYPLLVLLLFVAVDSTANKIRAEFPMAAPYLTTALAFVVGGWLFMHIEVSARRVLFRWQYGAGGYNTRAWVTSPTIHAIASGELEGLLFSNAPDAIYILSGRAAFFSPRRIPTDRDVYVNIPPGPQTYLVWFKDGVSRDYLVAPVDLAPPYHLVVVYEFEDSVVYRVSKRGD